MDEERGYIYYYIQDFFNCVQKNRPQIKKFIGRAKPDVTLTPLKNAIFKRHFFPARVPRVFPEQA